MTPKEVNFNDFVSKSTEIYEVEAANYWDKFYSFNQGKFFKDRHYLHFQFKDLSTKDGTSHLDGKKALEVGCGAGNTLFPLMKQHPNAFFYAFDFAAHAVDVVKVGLDFNVLLLIETSRISLKPMQSLCLVSFGF
jgi:tRNAThr (cytosine32-N3)-methyltransferase